MASRPLRFGFGKPEVSKSQICPALCLLSRVFFSGSRVSGNHVAHSSIMISTYLYLIVFQSIFSSVNPSTFRFFSSGILGNLMRPKYVAMCPKGKSENTKKIMLGNVVLGLKPS